jgi:hypothetical protein
MEAKHSMSTEKVKIMANRIKYFPLTLKQSTQKQVHVNKFSKVVGVACGTHFPKESRKEAHLLELMVIYPSGQRYVVETGKVDSDFAFER